MDNLMNVNLSEYEISLLLEAMSNFGQNDIFYHPIRGDNANKLYEKLKKLKMNCIKYD